MIKTIIFDYDGVLVDSFSNVHQVYRVIGRKLGVKIPDTVEQFRKIYGYDFHECYRNLGLNAKQQKQAVKIFEGEILSKEPAVFEGIDEVLSWAGKRYRLVLISANFAAEVRNKLHTNGLEHYFSSILGQEFGGGEVNKSDEFAAVLNQYNCKAEETVVIGDRRSDYDAAKRAGIDQIILADYGWGYDRSKIPDRIYHVCKPIQLISVIQQLDQSS